MLSTTGNLIYPYLQNFENRTKDMGGDGKNVKNIQIAKNLQKGSPTAIDVL